MSGWVTLQDTSALTDRHSSGVWMVLSGLGQRDLNRGTWVWGGGVGKTGWQRLGTQGDEGCVYVCARWGH